MNRRVKKISIIGLIAVVALIGFFHLIGQVMTEEDNHIDIVDLFGILEDGDLIFQESKSSQSLAIQIATDSKYSHLGIIYKNDNQLYVFEAVQPVKLTPIEEWIKRGEKGHFVVKRLKDSKNILTPSAKQKLREEGEKFKGKNYDLYFEWSDERIYCSELVWKMYKSAVNIEIGELQELREFNLNNKAVKQKIVERYGNNVPLDEIVISPSSMFQSDVLRTIYEK